MTKVKEKLTPTLKELFETNDFSSIMELCDKAQNDRKMIGLIADTGMGKTTALEAYSKRKNVFYVAYDKTMQPKHFFIALLKQMGIEFEGTINKMVNLIADELNKLQSPLILIDEAGKITHTMVLYLLENPLKLPP
jgi:DNA transposition AAA+ family ATPase